MVRCMNAHTSYVTTCNFPHDRQHTAVLALPAAKGDLHPVWLVRRTALRTLAERGGATLRPLALRHATGALSAEKC